ncbi:phage portal protein [Rhizobium leguminosarum]|uniref:Phage portal protein n=1 Tax=Rhizobium ruizarguesonis TaxID=2081791 RepID=A0AAE5C707_9HYPH|nr:phage portal protein [Rhizobium ruizarguesonis]NEI52706.1 phage portal protein [Rhizobium ruizarguesonis]
MNFIDRLIAAVSPQRALKREYARNRAAALAGARMLYDGATKGRRAQGWRVSSTDANAENLPALGRLRDVARDMVRNNPYAARAKAGLKNNIVGPGIFPSVVSPKKGERAKLEELIKAHFDTPMCDVNGQLDLYGLQSLVMATVAESGECLVRRRLRRAEDGYPLPFQLEVLEPDFLDSSKDGPLPNGGQIIQGVEFDPIGRRAAYWLFNVHPGSYAVGVNLRGYDSKRIPASEIAHVYRMDRPGQVRGVSWFAPVILKTRDLADYSDAQLVRQKVAACFAAFITAEDDVTNPDTIKEREDGAPYSVEELQPGILQRLRPGEDVTFGTPPSVGEYADYKRAELQEIAVGLGMSYEALSGDLQGVNFSSGRMGWLEFQRTISSAQNHMLLPQLCEAVGRWFLEAAELINGRPATAKIRWTPSPREMINPAEEIKAARDAIRTGLSSRPNEQRKLGHDPADLDNEIAESNKRADDLGLVFDSDPRRVSTAGNAVSIDAGAPSTPNGETDNVEANR